MGYVQIIIPQMKKKTQQIFRNLFFDRKKNGNKSKKKWKKRKNQENEL